MRNREKIQVKWIGTVKLRLESRFCLELFDSIYVPSMRCSLISSCRLDKSSYSCSSADGLFQLVVESHIFGTGVSNRGIYRLNLI